MTQRPPGSPGTPSRRSSPGNGPGGRRSSGSTRVTSPTSPSGRIPRRVRESVSRPRSPGGPRHPRGSPGSTAPSNPWSGSPTRPRRPPPATTSRRCGTATARPIRCGPAWPILSRLAGDAARAKEERAEASKDLEEAEKLVRTAAQELLALEKTAPVGPGRPRGRQGLPRPDPGCTLPGGAQGQPRGRRSLPALRRHRAPLFPEGTGRDPPPEAAGGRLARRGDPLRPPEGGGGHPEARHAWRGTGGGGTGPARAPRGRPREGDRRVRQASRDAPPFRVFRHVRRTPWRSSRSSSPRPSRASRARRRRWMARSSASRPPRRRGRTSRRAARRSSRSARP